MELPPELIDQIDQAMAEAETDPAVRATARLQAECREDVTFRVLENPMVIPIDAPAEISEDRWPDGTPVLVRRYWPRSDERP